MNSALFFDDAGTVLAAPSDVQRLLARSFHWKAGRSAYEAAHSWFDAGGLPFSIGQLLASNPAFCPPRFVRAIFEKQTSLDEFGHPSQTDLLAYLEVPSGRLVLAVEAKVDETFGPTVAQWLKGASPGKNNRLKMLADQLQVDAAKIDRLRYQLIHRTVAALIEARASEAAEAVFVVQSFGDQLARPGFADFQAFAAALGIAIHEPGQLSGLVVRNNVTLRLGWAQDHIKDVS